ncbi:MAG: Ppx/GppA family phosphatase [Candidatus Ancillula sp.]|jgi:exopolyphosphatase/guanosine-5'-triphosphate,3'-diphosphate pyrophosphatase|nr:Ppx/GppA family phosphatase [Candidatus Ancillula sp.]
MSKRVAAIDCGTNSVRLLVAEVQTDENGSKYLTDLMPRKVRISRLGFGVDKTHEFDQAALDRTFKIEKEYFEDINKFQVPLENVRFIATSASRDANNKEVFFETTKNILGIYPEVIAGEEEARLSFSGVVSALKSTSNNNICVVDLGGGSTEVVLDGKGFSMNIGSVRITERCFEYADIPNQEQINFAKEVINNAIDQAFAELRNLDRDITKISEIVGVAGTITSVTADILGLDKYDSEKVNGAISSLDEVYRSCDKIISMNKEQIKELGFINPGRVDVIQAGCLIWKTLLKRLSLEIEKDNRKLDHVTTSEHDILDGIALNI